MKRNRFTNMISPILGLMIVFGTISCKKDDPTPNPDMMRSATYMYEFNNGQLVANAAYDGKHMDDFSATMKVEETGSNMVKVSVTLQNTVSGQMYMVHTHDAADPSTTPNGTPYNETPNSAIFNQMATGNGGSVTISQNVSMSYDFITKEYQGFFVVHDPLQPISTTNIGSYLVVGLFARDQMATGYSSASFNYDFNTGQLVPAFAYAGPHPSNLSAQLNIQQTANGSRVSIKLMNAINGQMYMAHAHDMADPSTTPNGTPYNETPNSNVINVHVHGNGGTAYASQLSTMSIESLTTTYDGFIVVHDPMQPLSTTDPTTYVILGVFGR